MASTSRARWGGADGGGGAVGVWPDGGREAANAWTDVPVGTGPGPGICYGIVSDHGGTITVESTPGQGATFAIELEADEAPTATDPATTEPVPARGQKVLVVDDEPLVVELISRTLRDLGLRVQTAADGHEGVKLFDSHQHEISVVLLDRTMPSLSGADTYEAIHAIRADAKIILVSGYSEEKVTAELVGRGLTERSLAGFLRKPFLPDALLSRIEEVLDPVDV